MRRPILSACLAAALFVLAAAVPAAAQGPEVIILVRHAETAPDDTRDPALSDAGIERAGRLAALLADAGLTAVHSTAYRRTRGTATPVAEQAGLEVAGYDPRDLRGFATELLGSPGRHLVVGHSNTTPALVELLGGDPGPPIAEDEHGRVYVLVPTGDGVRSLVLRY